MSEVKHKLITGEELELVARHDSDIDPDNPESLANDAVHRFDGSGLSWIIQRIRQAIQAGQDGAAELRAEGKPVTAERLAEATVMTAWLDGFVTATDLANSEEVN